ncbi:uncharacterized protein [Cicer arietinum]
MGDFLSGLASSVTRDLVCGAVKELRYPCCFNNLVEELQNENDRVVETRNSVQDRIDRAKKQTKKTAGLVENWLKQANDDIDNVEELLKKAKTNKSFCFGRCPNWIWRYQLGRQLSERKRMIKIYNKEGSHYAEIERLTKLPGLGYFSSERCLKFDSRKYAYDQLVNALKNDKVNMIGLYGMGGCGKTTLAIDIGKRAKEENVFEEVIFVVVSSTVEIQKIQEDIAFWLECALEGKTEMQRAQRLHKRLIQEENILLILDNVWEPLDFVAIGVPSWKNHKGCKVLVTTRLENVCTRMDCQRMISLPLLTDEEAWGLFQIQAQISEATSDNLKHLARRISDKCEGLPVLITAVASTLKGKAEVEWKVALGRLENSKPLNIEKGLQNPYKCLQLSYDNLDMKEAKSLFLLCCVFPEEYEIPMEDLTRLAVGLGLVGEIHSHEGARNEVCAAKTKLVSSSLLLDAGEGKCVKMHDLIHKVALLIAEEEGKGIKCALEKDVTVEYSLLLRYLWCEKFPYQLDCSNLEFLCINTYSEVSDEIFKEMKRLRVLFLVNKGIERRPLLINSFQFQSLKNLCCLLLENWELGDISFLGDPKKLESLTLRKCSFLELPNVLITQLSSLRLLDLSECDMERNPFEVIGGHLQLEELYIDDCRSEWDSFNESTYELFSMFSVPRALQRYRIHLGTMFVGYEERLLNCRRTLFLSCFDTKNAAVKELAKKTEALLIANIQGGGAKTIIPDIFEIDVGGMNELIELMICTSKDIEHLVDIGNHLSRVGTLFSALRKLRIKCMEHLRSLYHGHPPSGLFEKLEELYIEECPQLHGTLFVWKLNLCSLKVLELYECTKLTSLVTHAVAQSLVQLERLEIFYCHALKHILADDNKEEISKNDDRLVFSKLKQLIVRRCKELEYIIPVTCAHGLLQLECLEIKFTPKLMYVFGQSNSKHDNQSHKEMKINLPALEKLTLSNMPNLISMCPNNFHLALPSLRQFTLQSCPEVAIMSINAYMVDVKGKQCDHNITEIKKEWSLKEVRAVEKHELVGRFLLAGPSIYEEQDPLRICLQKLSYTCSGLIQSMNLQNLEEIEVSGNQVQLQLQGEKYLNFLNLHLESNRLEGLTSIPSASLVNYNSGSFNLCILKRIILRSCSMLRTLFSPSTATHLISLEELTIEECHELRYLVTYGEAHEHKEEIICEDHVSQSYVATFPKLESITVVNCNLLEYLFHVSYAQGLVKLKDIEIRQTHGLMYVFGHSIHDIADVHSSHQYQNKIQIELPVLEKVELFSMPNMINIFPESYYMKCSSLQRIVMEDVGLSTLSVNNLMVHPTSSYLGHTSILDIVEAGTTNVQVLGSVAIWNSSKIKGIFHQDEHPMNRRQATSWLIDLNLVNLPELTYIWKGAKHFVTLQNLKFLYIWGCQKLKAIFSSAVSRSLPQLKILVILQCEGLEEIIEDSEELENTSNTATAPKVCFSKLKLLLVTQCNNLKRLFNLSASHEFPELEYLIINQDRNLEEVFECEQGMRERNVEVFLPELKHVILMQLPNLNNISQRIEIKTLTNLFVHNCPKLSLTSTTTIEDMLQSYNHDREIDFFVRCDLLYIRDIINKESAEKDQTESGSELPSFQANASSQIVLHNLTGSQDDYEYNKKKLVVDQQSTNEPSFQDQRQELGETIVTAEVAQISIIPISDSVEDMAKESVQEGSTLEETTKSTLSVPTEVNGFGGLILTHSKPNGRDMFAQHSHVNESIQEGSNSMDKESGTSVVSIDNIEIPPELRAYKDFDDMDDAQVALVVEAIAIYPHLRKVYDKFSKRFQGWMLKTLADMLLFLRNESSVSITPQQEKDFHRLCDEAVQLGFDKSWVDGMRQRVIVRVPEVERALARLEELLKRHNQLTQELDEIKSEVNNLNDFVAAQKKCFDFL